MMKKALLPILVVGVTGLTVAVATAAKPQPVTISLSKPVVTFGGSATLSGSIGSHQASQKVDVLGKQYAQATFLSVASVDTTSVGNWTYTASPTVQTAYEAKWLTATSRVVTVKVRPQLALTKVNLSGNRGTFSVKATANRSFAGRFVLLQRLTSSGNSSATFTIRVQPGNSRLRAVMPTSQTQPGYVATQSPVLTIHR